MACICEKIQVKTDNQGRIASCSDFNIGAGYQSILRTRNLGTVSYTHLDVYKRQIDGRVIWGLTGRITKRMTDVIMEHDIKRKDGA